jgi:serine/threonine kinase 16
MMLMLGVANALQSMHQYRVKSGAQSTRRAKGVRQEGADADADRTMQMKPKRRPSQMHGDDEADEENAPLMDDEVTQSQEGVQDGGLRPYAHRDIKPGTFWIRPYNDITGVAGRLTVRL